jgi:hypothetical protein
LSSHKVKHGPKEHHLTISNSQHQNNHTHETINKHNDPTLPTRRLAKTIHANKQQQVQGGQDMREAALREIDRETSNDKGFKGENLNIQRQQFNYSHVIHPASESSM